MALYYGLILTPFFDRLLYMYLSANAWLSSGILNALGQNTLVSEIVIRSARFAITVRRGCDGIEPAWFFCSAVLSFPAPIVRKISGIVAGVVLVLGLNVVRIVTLFLVGLHYPGFFDTLHLEIWPVIFILVVILLWAGWARWTKRIAGLEPHVAS